MTRRAGLLRHQAGGTAVEFALVAPVLLMFLFMIMSGSRILFAKQSLSEVSNAAARCMAIKATGCADTGSTQTWAIARGNFRALSLAASNVTITTAITCNGQTNMSKAVITIPTPVGALPFLPKSILPANLTSTACFPAA